MTPVAIQIHSKKGYIVVHRCTVCGHEMANKLALDDPIQPDEMDTVVRILREAAR